MKNIFITGGTGKIGGQIVAHYLREGQTVITTSRKKENALSLQSRFELSSKMMSNLHVIEVNFKDNNAEKTIINFFISNKKLLPHVLVNNARSLDNLKTDEKGQSSVDAIANEYLINVILPYRLSVGLANISPVLYCIINISSIYGIVPFNPNLYTNYEKSAPIQYSLSKAAVIHLSKELSVRLREQKIRVNTVSYGGVIGRVDEDFKKRYALLCPEGVMLTEEQTTGPVIFLASEHSLGVTGQNIIQDGGWTVW